MTPDELTTWRSRMGWTAKEAAAQLGLSQNGYAAYERGYAEYMEKRGVFNHPAQSPRPIPKHVALACEWLEQMRGGQAAAVDKSGKVG